MSPRQNHFLSISHAKANMCQIQCCLMRAINAIPFDGVTKRKWKVLIRFSLVLACGLVFFFLLSRTRTRGFEFYKEHERGAYHLTDSVAF